MAEQGWNKFIPIEATKDFNKYVKKVTAATNGNINPESFVKSTLSELSHNDEARNMFNKMAEHADKLPIGQEIFDKGNQAIEFIKKIDPSNSSGAVQPALDMMQKLVKNTDPMQALKGMMGGELYGVLNQVMGLINKKGGGGGGNQGGIQAGSPCSLEDPVTHVVTMGTMQMNNNAILVCIPLPTSNTTIVTS
jgi:hypothetical protein